MSPSRRAGAGAGRPPQSTPRAQPPQGSGTGQPPRAEEAKLGVAEVTASTVANTGTGEFYFAFGTIAVTAGVAAPLTVLAAGLAVFFLATIVAEFTRIEPSAGSFITYVETSLGARAGVVTALLSTIGFTIAIAGVFTMSGGMISLTVEHWTSFHLSWLPISLLLTAGAILLTLRGARVSTAVVGMAILLQLLIMLSVCVVVLVDPSVHSSTVPFQWSHLRNGLAGLAAGFPLAMFMFIGWENGAALAEETREPRRTVPRALYLALAIVTTMFILFSYTTIAGFHYETSSIGRASVPFLEMARHYLGTAALIAWLSGIISVLTTLVAAVNSQSRMIFDGGRSGLLPAWLGRSRPPGETPVNALVSMSAVGMTIVVTWWLLHATKLLSGGTAPVNLYAEASTMGTILILFVYVLTAVSLPVFIWRRYRESFSLIRHVAVPVLGIASLAIPFAELFHPGQPFPYSAFPYVSVGILLLACITAGYVVARNPHAGEGEGRAMAEG